MNENKVKKGVKNVLSLLYSRGIITYKIKKGIWNDYVQSCLKPQPLPKREGRRMK